MYDPPLVTVLDRGQDLPELPSGSLLCHPAIPGYVIWNKKFHDIDWCVSEMILLNIRDRIRRKQGNEINASKVLYASMKNYNPLFDPITVMTVTVQGNS